MAEFFEFDPQTGIKTEFECDEDTGALTLIRSADMTEVLDYTNKIRNEGGMNKEAIAESWWPYCTLPPIAQLHMISKGIDIQNDAHFDRMLQEVNEHFPYLKLTTGKEGKSSAPVYFMPGANK
jgi:hypothetical protein